MRAGVLILLTGLLTACSATQTATDEDASLPEFRDCDDCPLMVELPAGEYLMGTAVEDRLIDPRTGKPAKNDSPQHQIP